MSKKFIEEGNVKRREPYSAEHFIKSHYFHGICSFVITLNAIFIGIQTDVVTKDAAVLPMLPDPEWFDDVNMVFVALFFAEVFLRLLVQRVRFFCGREWKWNIFDLV